MTSLAVFESPFSLLLQTQLAAALSVAPLTTGGMRAVTDAPGGDDQQDTVRWDAASDTGKGEAVLPGLLTDWLDGDPDLDSLKPVGQDLYDSDRAYLSERWDRVAEKSHLDIGTFARVTLDLMNFDAPLALLSASQEAGLSAVRHEEIAQHLAARLGGERQRTFRPERESDVPLVGTLVELAVCAFHELYVGRSLSAVRVSEQLRYTSSTPVAAALAGLLSAHTSAAALGDAVLEWTLELGGNRVEQALLQAAASAQGQIRDFHPLELPQGADTAALGSYGVLAPEGAREAFLRAWREVVLPAMEKLLVTDPQGE